MKRLNNAPKSRQTAAAGEAMARALNAVEDKLGTLNRVLADRGESILEVSAIVEGMRNVLQRLWSAFCELGVFPFNKREADMYVSIGRNIVNKLTKEMIERLPKSLTGLYALSHLDQAVLESYIAREIVTPRTTDKAARILVQRQNGTSKPVEEKPKVEQHFKKLASFVTETLPQWTRAQRKGALAELKSTSQVIHGHVAKSESDI